MGWAISYREQLLMALSVVGTPLGFQNSGTNYTPEAGSNRLVVFVVLTKESPQMPLASITYNGTVRTPTVSISDANFETAHVCIFKQSELPAGASAVTTTYTGGTPAGRRVVAYTVRDADQSTTVRNSASNSGVGQTSTTSHAGLTIGDLLIGGDAHRSGGGGGATINNGWTLVDGVDINGGDSWSGFHITTGTTDGINITSTGTDDWAAVSVALIEFNASATILMGAMCL
jgi:hypothetical protein